MDVAIDRQVELRECRVDLCSRLERMAGCSPGLDVHGHVIRMLDGADGISDGFSEIDEISFGDHEVFEYFDDGSVSPLVLAHRKYISNRCNPTF